jgi:DNA invertase Pin-like site-specific DNA recombinase
MSSKKTEASQPIVRCAIYTRKSTDERLDMQLNSLDSQRGAAEAFIASQKSEGWVCCPKLYDDGGFTGGNLDRPAFKQLMNDIEAGEIDCVVVYKVDRLSRSLLDFARAMETFDANGVSFVSVTQQFNTTHSMGRLTLNILLSFAQFERDIIGERIRDKIAAQRQKGLWCGGQPVLGYDVDRSEMPGRLPRITRLMSLAIRFDELLRTGKVRDLYHLATIGNVSQARISQILSLVLLAPDIQESLLFLPRITEGKPRITEKVLRPLVVLEDWDEQRKAWIRLGFGKWTRRE